MMSLLLFFQLFLGGDSMSVARETILGGQSRLPEVISETLPTQVPQRQIPLIIHRMPSTPPSVASRNQRFMFSDETLLAPDLSVKQEFKLCKNAGASAIVEDNINEESAEAARESGLKLILLPNMSPLRMVWYNADIKDPVSVARYWVKMIQEAYEWKDVIYSQNGRPVMWLFDATRASANYYKKVREEVKKMGYDPLILYHAQLRKGNSRLPEVETYLKVFDGAVVWGDGYTTIREMLELVVSARDKIEHETGKRKQVILTTKPGHWRPEKGLLIDSRGTKEFRQTIDLAYQYNLDGLNIESWNDFSESHHVQPSVLKSTTLSDLCKYYGNLGIGKIKTFNYPAIHVSHRREIVTGEYFECEILYLPVANRKKRKIRLVLKSREGEIIYSSNIFDIKPGEAGAKTYNIPIRSIRIPEEIFPVLEINEVMQPTETFCTVTAGRMLYPFTMNISMEKALHLKQINYTINGQKPGKIVSKIKPGDIQLNVESEKKLARIELIKDYIPVHCVAYDQFLSAKSFPDKYHVLDIQWDIPGPIASLKDTPQMGMNFSGSVSLKGGEAFHAIHVKKSVPVLKSPYLVDWSKKMPASPHDGVKIAFRGDSNTVFNLTFPNQSSTVQVKWGDLVRKGEIEFPLLSHSRLLLRRGTSIMGHPFSLDRKSWAGEIHLPDDTDKSWSLYFVRIIADDQSIFRSVPFYIATKDQDDFVKTYSWDTSKAERFVSEMPRVALQNVAWKFEMDGSRRISDINKVGYYLELGGMFERDGRFDPDQVPVRVMDREEAVLKFDGNDIAMTRPQLIPIGSWMLDLWIKPYKTNSSSEQVIFEVGETISIVLQPNGTLRCWFGDRSTNVRLEGNTRLMQGTWHRISFVYDLQDARLLLDGKVEASVPVKGFRERITQKACFGAGFPASTHMDLAERGFIGLMKNITISCQAEELDSAK